MFWSKVFIPTLKDSPQDAEVISHQLMLRAGMIRKVSSGIYTWLPLGLKVLRKIENIVREEMDQSGAQEVLMPMVHPKELWEETKRWEKMGPELLRFKDRHDRDFCLGPTHEEVITDLVRNNVKSYKELPLNIYQIQTKFRDEIRPRYGVMRGREFLMKDAYSFDVDYASSIISYNRMFIAYMQLFKKIGLKAIPMKADTGPIGGDLSHEFIIIADTGESEVYFEKELLDYKGFVDQVDYDSNLQGIVDKYTSFYAATDEKHDPKAYDKDLNNLIKAKGIEVGHIFHFGQKYSNPMQANINTYEGKNIPVFMGSYGVGLSRLVGAVIEASHDKDGIIWPKEIAPWYYHLINLKNGDEECDKICFDVYNSIKKQSKTVLYDDTSDRAGAKLAKADLIGLPVQIIIGPRGIKDKIFDLKIRKNGDIKKLSYNELLNFINNN